MESSAVQLDEDTVEDLTETQQLEDLLDLGADLVDTSDADNKSNFRLSSFVEVASLLSQATESDFGSLQRSVFLDVTLSTLEDDLSVCFVFLAELLNSLLLFSSASFDGLFVLEEGLGDSNLCISGLLHCGEKTCIG